jgi:hypothetical protein
MSNKNRTVYQRSDGTWVNKLNKSDRASSLHDTQREAENTAKEMLRNQGGGELTTMGENGRISVKLPNLVPVESRKSQAFCAANW